MYDRSTGTVMRPPGRYVNDTAVPINGHSGSVRKRRGTPNSHCASRILGLTRRRRTLDEIYFDLSKEARNASAKHDLTPHVEEESETSVLRVDVNDDKDSCQELSTVIPTEPISAHRPFLSRLRNTLFPNSMKTVKTEHCSADQVNVSEIVNTEDSITSVLDLERHRTLPLHVHNLKLSQILRNKSSIDSVTSDDGTTNNGFGPCCVHHSNDTFTFELGTEPNGSETQEVRSNKSPVSYDITHL